MTPPSSSLSPRTIAVVAGRPEGIGEPLSHPIVLASNFRGNAGDYARTNGTEQWVALEAAVGALEGGQAVSYASGMAAASAILFALAPKVLVLPKVSYMGVRALVAEHVRQHGLEAREVDATDMAAVAAAAVGADLVWMDTPSNPTLDVSDLDAAARIASANGARLVVDSTFATPVNQRPIEHGATVVMHSATKFIGGHSDLLLGLCVTPDPVVFERLRTARVLQGATPGALEAFLALRGLRTLPVRMAAAEANARVLVARLTAHPAIERVLYPGQGAMVSFVVRGGADGADRVCDRVQIVVPATSLGGVETTMERRQKYAGDAHVPPGLIRMSVGIEDVADIWADLDQALSS